MKIRRVLLVLKKTALHRLEASEDPGSRRMLELVEESDDSVHGILAAHEQHVASVAVVKDTLRARRIEYKEAGRLPSRPIQGYDLVLSVGGDGTALAVSHAIRNGTPLLGVNSAPAFSVGYLTGTTSEGFAATLDGLLSGALEPLSVQRLQIRIGKRSVAEPVLNDVLYCANNPGIITRYKLTWPDGDEMQRSSGVWIATPAGSTGALASAGGPILPLTARQYAFYVREPYSPPGMGVRLRSAVLVKEDRLTIENRIHGASLFIDGSFRVIALPFGSTATFTLHERPLRLVRGPHGS